MCGVFGIFGHPEAANLTYLGLHALQHRGQESAGIVTTDGTRLFAHRQMGLVQEAIGEGDLAKLPGSAAVGHVRYSTAGGSHLRNAQPFAVEFAGGSMAIAHNGNLTNTEELRARLEKEGSIFQSTADTELVMHLVARSTQGAIEDRLVEALLQVRGAFSMVFLNEKKLIAVRDPHGVRPLCIGSLPNGVTVVASESTAFDLIDATFERDVAPGEMLVVDETGARSFRPFPPVDPHPCLFEYVYFARPDSPLAGRSVYEARVSLGKTLAREAPAAADVVVPVPDSGTPAAIGYAEASGIPFSLALVRSHYVGRTFIEPQQAIRHFGVKLKLNPVRSAIEGKRVVVVDDSIVRGTTSRKIVKMVRAAGATEVHVRISSPPTRWPCYYGIDTPTRAELIASSHSVDEIGKYITADSLAYLSIDGMREAIGLPGTACMACWTGEYPIPFSAPAGQRQLHLVGI
jgi:amidophosphoribosyltransferase